MEIAKHLLTTLAAYLLGSLPIGYLMGKLYGVDVRLHGSGRTGGTNVWRATGQIWPPLFTILGDAGKGLLAVWIGRRLGGSELAAALAGVAAVLGHNWPVFLRFKGGAGGIAAGACLLMLNPTVGAITIPVSLLALYLSHYASVGTLAIGAGGFLVMLILRISVPALAPPVHLLFGALTTAAIAYALRPNLTRLIRGTERRITLW
jgi:glycerol-3-phosphate acyltransferase PlsY